MRRGLLLAVLVAAGCSSSGAAASPGPASGGGVAPAAAPGSAGAETRPGASSPATPGAAARLPGQPDPRPAIAVFPFENGGAFGGNPDDYQAFTVGAQQMLLTELAQNSSLRIVERTMLREIMAEQDLASSGRVDPQTAARIGQLVGARYIITGVFFDNFGEFRMDARIIDVETGEIVRADQVRNRRERLYDMLVDLAGRITAGVNLPPLPTQVRDERMRRQIPPEALTLYSRAQVFEDMGNRDRAIELYRSIAEQFPQMTEAREALRQLQG